ncbi:Inner nuclear membrane protein Man1, partial [Eufriesea mexicana]
IHHQNAAVATPGGTQESFLAINHVRDNLIPPKDRKKMAGLWEKAVKFLDENESRIRREVQQVAGEEFYVWRWLPNNNLKSNTQNFVLSKKSKVWQGQAFETMEGSVNSLTCSPTPCLKIRHMFDADVEFEDDWETKVQDAILEKCGETVKILHIRVDRGSREGCVYMKCMSQEDAGKAYRALHGCWFDGHLVTVKYLRLERYYERFPDARRCTTPLKPSNNQRLSMQADY